MQACPRCTSVEAKFNLGFYGFARQSSRMPARPPPEPAACRPTRAAIATAFGRAVARTRIASRKSQLVLAADASIEGSHMGKLERGQHNPNLVALVKIAVALGCSAQALAATFEEELRALERGSAGEATG